MKTYISILILFFCIQVNFVFAQQNLVKEKLVNTTIQNIEGTYQIQVINIRDQPYIPANLTQLVIDNRHTTDIVYVNLGTSVRLKIIPTAEITKPDFKPLEKIVHIAE